MTYPPTHPRSVLAIMLALATAGCGGKSSDEGGVTPGDIEQLLEDSFGQIPNLGNALQRVIATLQGNPQPGVTLTPITDGVQGTVGVDVDGNGSMEATVHGTLVYIDPSVGIDGGATLTITSIDGAAVDGGLTVAVVPLSPTDLAFGPGSGSFETAAGTVTVPQINMTVDIATATPVLDGFATFTVEDAPGSMFFEGDSQGGFQIRVVFGGEEVTVP